MSLEGKLEDVNLLEVMQIIAFAGRTGTLTIESARTSGTVLFESGAVRCAFSTSTLPILSGLCRRPKADYPGVLLRDGIRTTLHELAAVREGRYSFSAESALPVDYAGVELSKFIDSEGIEPQELILDLARDFDVARRRLLALLRSADPNSPVDEGEQRPEAVKDLLEAIVEPTASGAQGIARILARIGSRYVERSVLFLVDGTTIHGPDGSELDRNQCESLALAIHSRNPIARHIHDGSLGIPLPPGDAPEYALIPLVYYHDVLAILLCDNFRTGEPVGEISGLALFVEQAGMAMEKSSLERRLQVMEHPLSLANQGPLVQVATPMLRE